MNKKVFLILICVLAGALAVFLAVKKSSVKSDSQSVIAALMVYSDGDKKSPVDIYFTDVETEKFLVYKTEIFENKLMENRIKQVLLILFSAPPDGYLTYIPQGSAVREVFMDPNGICYVDLDSGISANFKGGTSAENHAVYAIVNTIMKNFPKVNGVRFLINGKEAETLAGHIKIDGILKAD